MTVVWPESSLSQRPSPLRLFALTSSHTADQGVMAEQGLDGRPQTEKGTLLL